MSPLLLGLRYYRVEGFGGVEMMKWKGAWVLLFSTGFTLGQIIEIPDPNFKTLLVIRFDTDNDSEISVAEAEAVTSMNCSSFNIIILQLYFVFRYVYSEYVHE